MSKDKRNNQNHKTEVGDRKDQLKNPEGKNIVIETKNDNK